MFVVYFCIDFNFIRYKW